MSWQEQETGHSSLGNPFEVWVERRARMPRIADDILKVAIYPFPSESEARQGRLSQSGGSGFLVGFVGSRPEPLNPYESHHDYFVAGPDMQPDKYFQYAVTNAHVVDTAPVVRVNTKKGGTEAIPLKPSDWIRHEKSDLAVAAVELTRKEHLHLGVAVSTFLTEREAEYFDVGPGDDVFTVGRFVNHQGVQTIQPSIRFGNVSMMPGDELRVDNIPHPQIAFLVETRTIPGYSGSSVFLSIPRWELAVSPKYAARLDFVTQQEAAGAKAEFFRLLGVAGGYLRSRGGLARSGRPRVCREWAKMVSSARCRCTSGTTELVR